MVYGNMGGDGQPQTQSAVFSAHARARPEPAGGDRGAALAARTHLGPDQRYAQARVAVCAGGRGRAARRGHEVEIVQAYDEIVGHAGCVVRHPDGTFEGGADPRSDGSVAAY